MKRIGWGVVLAMLLGSSSIALADDAKPAPGVEMSLEERGPCSVIECEPMTPRKRELIEREIMIRERVLRNADMRPKGDVLLKLHRLHTELMHAELLELNALHERADAACSR